MSDPSKNDSQETIAEVRAGLAAGMLLKDRYRVQKELGAGGIGMVFLAQDTQLYDRPVVVKVLHERSEDNTWLQKKFRQEVEALVRIKHPGVVGVFDAGQMPDGKLFVVMEFVQGVDLRSVLKGLREGMGLDRAANIMRQVGPALTAAHDEGVFHCDLKPENIMLQTSKQGDELVKLIDFGVAKVKDSLVAALTETRVAGTFLYMAPEQLMGTPSALSDIYALGVIAYEMLTQKGPFPARTVTHLYELQRTGVQVNPRELRPDVSPAAEQAILKALSFDPETRYQRARDFTDDLSKALLLNQATAAIGFQNNHSIEVPLDSANLVQPTTRLDSLPDVAEPPRTRLGPYILAALLAAAALGGYGIWKKVQPVAPPTVRDIPPPAVQKERSLNYYIEMQKYRDGKPFGNPVRLAKEVLFERDYRVRLFFSSPEPGYLYLLNEGPAQRDGGVSFNVLFPTTSTNNGSAQLEPGQSIQIPSGWFKFDAESGTEKLWIVWADDTVPELEAVKNVANPEDRGVVSNSEQLAKLQSFFNQHSSVKPIVEKQGDKTVVRSNAKILVNLLELEHY